MHAVIPLEGDMLLPMLIVLIPIACKLSRRMVHALAISALIRVQNLRSSAPAEYLTEVDPGILKGVWGAPKMVPYEFLCDVFSLYRSIREIATNQLVKLSCTTYKEVSNYA